MKSVWVNVDHVQKHYVIHVEGNCHWVRHRGPSKYKMINALGKHGGWLQFDSRLDAEKYHKERALKHRNMPCGFCYPTIHSPRIVLK